LTSFQLRIVIVIVIVIIIIIIIIIIMMWELNMISRTPDANRPSTSGI
jgi:hypothetical protein